MKKPTSLWKDIIFFSKIDQILFYYFFWCTETFHFGKRMHAKKKWQILLLNKHVSKRKVISQYIREVSDVKENGIVLLIPSLTTFYEKFNSSNYIFKKSTWFNKASSLALQPTIYIFHSNSRHFIEKVKFVIRSQSNQAS